MMISLKWQALLTGTVILVIALHNGPAQGQRITSIQLDGVQYFVSVQNPYSPKLNFYLAYQYCRNIGFQLLSLETREKADVLSQYLQNAGYGERDFWSSGNRLGTSMWIWMSSGQPFNATFNYMKGGINNGIHGARQAVGRQNDGQECVSLVPSGVQQWQTGDCLEDKDFICEQARCFYYNYGSIPVTASQGHQETPETGSKPADNESPSTENEVLVNEESSTESNVITSPSSTSSSSPPKSPEHIATTLAPAATTVRRYITLRPSSSGQLVSSSPPANFQKPASSQPSQNSENTHTELHTTGKPYVTAVDVNDPVEIPTPTTSAGSYDTIQELSALPETTENLRGKGLESKIDMQPFVRQETVRWGAIANSRRNARDADNN